MDMHCHLLWGVDDGAHILRDSLEIISRLKEKGFRGAYCTPHISSRYPSNTPARLKARFQQLLDALPDRDFDLRLAAEYMLDHHFEQALASQGISFQGNIGSLFGLYGKSCQAAARKFQKENLYLWWGTDAHNANMLTKLRL